MVVIGGTDTLEGAVIGTLLFFVPRELFAHQGTVSLGLLAIVSMMVARLVVWARPPAAPPGQCTGAVQGVRHARHSEVITRVPASL